MASHLTTTEEKKPFRHQQPLTFAYILTITDTSDYVMTRA